MKPTDEDVTATAKAGVNSWDSLPESLRVMLCETTRHTLEAYTPRLIERLAREADEVSATIEYGDSEDGCVFEPLSDWLRSHLEKSHD